MSQFLIGVIGEQPGVGKDTVAEYLQRQHGFRRIALADRLYAEVAKAYRVTIQELGRRDLKDTPQDRFSLLNCSDEKFVTCVRAEGIAVNQPLPPLCFA